MAIDTNLLSRYALGSTREDLSDKIYNTDPVETPFMSAIGREKSENIMKEWNVDTLQAATDNVVTAGANFEADALVSATKLNAYHQVSRIDVQVDRRADVVAKPGRRQEIAYQIMKAMKTLKNSVELTILKRKIGEVGNATGANGTGGETAGAPAWLLTNVDIGLLGTDPTLVSGRPGIAGTPGTKRGLSEQLILEAKQDVYDRSMGDPNMLLLSPGLKRSLSGYLFGNSSARIAAPTQDFGPKPSSKGAMVQGTVMFWNTDFGMVKIMPSRFIEDGSVSEKAEVLLIDPEYWAVSYLTGFTKYDIAKDGDNSKKMLLVDFALCSKNEKTSASIAAIDPAVEVSA